MHQFINKKFPCSLLFVCAVLFYIHRSGPTTAMHFFHHQRQLIILYLHALHMNSGKKNADGCIKLTPSCFRRLRRRYHHEVKPPQWCIIIINGNNANEKELHSAQNIFNCIYMCTNMCSFFHHSSSSILLLFHQADLL